MPTDGIVLTVPSLASPIRCPLAGGYEIRVPEITCLNSGNPVDPRPLFTVQFQLIVPGTAAYGGTWTPGVWEGGAPSTGPYAAVINIGTGQPAPVNPAAAGVYRLIAQFVGADASPIFRLAIVEISTP